jgi:ATP-binding cassette, subfamily B, bacterial
MSAQSQQESPSLELPYWRIESVDTGRLGIVEFLRKVIGALRPTVALLRRAAPRAALAVLVFQLLSGIATAAALLTMVRAIAALIDAGFSRARLIDTWPVVAAMVLIFVLRLVFDAVAMMAKASLVPKVRRAAETELYAASLAADLESFDDPAFYDRLLRARDRGVMHLEGAVDATVDIGSAFFAVAGSAVALAVLHPVLLLVLSLALLPEAIAALASARLQYAGMPKTIVLTRHVQMMAELATGRASAAEVRANQTQAFVRAEYDRQAAALQDHLIGLGKREARIVILGRALSGLGLLANFALLFWMLLEGWLAAAAAGAAVVAIRGASGEIARLIQAANTTTERALYISDYHGFIADTLARARVPKTPHTAAGAEQPDATPAAADRYLSGRVRLELRDIGFHYPNAAGEPALRDISLTIHPGETVALVGENGSGKTTLAKLMAGLYRPTQGTMLWDGVDTAALDPQLLAARVAMVLQEPIRWPRSARDNVRLGRIEADDADDARLLQAARDSQALDVVERLPKGWQTLLSKEFQGGRDLSVGQWQRLAVARGLFRDAPLVIWDEPTAPLDAKAECAVYESLRRLAVDRTVVLITHRLASIRDADRIFVLHHGRIVETGRHDELLALGGRYAQLYRLQARMNGLDEGPQAFDEDDVALTSHG